MKNYELIAELVKYPAGYEVSIDTVFDRDKLQYMDSDKVRIETEISCIDRTQECIFLG